MSSPSCSDCTADGLLDAPGSTADAVSPTTTGDDIPTRWAAVGALALGVFGLVTAEFLPASLLTALASDLSISEGAAGQTVTATALIGAIAAPSIPLLTRRIDRKHVMLALTTLLVLSNALAVVADSLWPLLTARVMLGVALGGFWSMAAALAMRLVPESKFPRAMSFILTGVSVATVCAAPVGAWMGELWGWRSAFVAAGVVSVITLLAQIFTLPALPPTAHPDLRVLGQLLGRPGVRMALLAVLLVISGHFAGFTYLRPLMENVHPPSSVGGDLGDFVWPMAIGGFVRSISYGG